MKLTLSFRLLCMQGGLISALILSSAYGLEYGFGLEPCPLCLLQRYALWGSALLFWCGVFASRRTLGRLILSSGAALFSLLGAVIAARHVWMQYLTPPAELEACTASFQRLLAYAPLWEVLKKTFSASQDCARIDFSLLGLSLPVWSLLSFIALAILGASVVWLTVKRRI